MRPRREHSTSNRQTYFVTSRTMGSRRLFQVTRWAELFVETLFQYRKQGAFELHAFVVMPDHFHALITPSGSLERAVQYIKGGFSFRAKKIGCQGEIWQQGFSDHRIRDAADYGNHVEYIEQNPMRARLCLSAAEYPFSSVRPGHELDPLPQRLKPFAAAASGGGPEGPPFQSKSKGFKSVLTVVLALMVSLSGAEHVKADSCLVKPVRIPKVCGFVLDTSGVPISDLTVVLVGQDRRELKRAVSSQGGDFEMQDVPAGSYLLKIESEVWDSLGWPLKITRSNAKRCGKLIQVSLFPKSSSGCMSSMTAVKTRPQPKANAPSH